MSTQQLEATQLRMAKREIALAIQQKMKAKKVSQSELARRMNTSRAVVHRLCKVDDDAVTLSTLAKAATALECGMRFRLVPA